MIEKQTISDDEPSTSPSAATPQPLARKYPWGLLAVAVIFVLAAFASWYGTWFGRSLSDDKLREYLSASARPRDTQHALSQISNKIIANDPAAKQWYPSLITAADNPAPEVRLTAAWVMGQDNTHADFHPALLRLLEDQDPSVRHNAALSLIRFGDAAGRPELLRMLQPTTLSAPESGAIEFFVKEEGTAIGKHAPLVRITKDNGQAVELRATEDCRIETFLVLDGARVEASAEVLRLSPSVEQVWEGLRGLYLIGQSEDLAAIERFTQSSPGVPDRVRQQALSTLAAIRARAENRR